MFGGIDKRGVHLFMCDVEGNMIKTNILSVGSGQATAYAMMDAHYNWDMEKDACVELAVWAINCATYADAGSGGKCFAYWIPEGGNGWEKVVDGVDNSKMNWDRMVQKGKTGVKEFRENCGL